MKKKEFKKGMSLFLSILMIFTMIPATVFNIGAEEIYPVMKAFNAASGDDFHKYYRQVYTVTFLDEIDTDAMNGALESWDVSADSDGSVMSWMYLNEEATAAAGQDRYDVYVAGDGGVSAHENTTHMFYVFSSLKEVKGMENFHTGNVKSFLYWFGNCNELESIDLSYLDTSSATTLRFCFYACYKLKEINASTWNTSNITTLERMFYRCYALESADLSGWDTSNITNMLGVFEMTPPTNVSPDYALKSVDLTGWDTSNVTTMENMFKNCEALTELDLSSFDTSKVTSMRFMFYYCKQLKNIYVGDGWTTEAIENINDGVFNCCYALVGGTDDQAENEQIYNDKHPSAYYPPNVKYAKFKEDGGYLTNVSQKPEEKKYTVTYEFIGDVLPENVTAPDSAVYTEGATVTVADNSSAEHYIFSGWSTQDATVENGQFVINNDVHFVGSWTRLYKVEYKYSEDFIVPEGAPEIPDTELWYAAGEDVPLYGVPYVHGYIFVGWYTDDADVAGDGFTMQDNDVTLYGYFKKPVESVEIINNGDVVINKGEKDKINVYVKPEDATIKDIIYESSDESVVIIDKYGNVEAVGEGTATVTVYSKDDPTKSDTVTVTVKTFVTDVEVDKNDILLNKGETDKITATVTPDDATNKEVTYESGDETVVKVDENGNITAVGEGTTTITVASKDDPTVKEEVTVTVKIPVTEVTAGDDFTLNIGEEKNVDASVNEDATNKELIYESDNPGVVKVDSDGNVIAVGEGTATITVTSKDDPTKKETVTVTVKRPVEDIIVDNSEIELEIGETDKITVTVTPDNATNKEVTYESGDETVVKVDEKGNITAVGEGTTTITVTSKDDPSIKETVEVTVIRKFIVTYEFIGDVIPEDVTAPAMKEYLKDTEVAVESDAAAEGYVFSGWSTDDADVTDGVFIISNDVRFVGSWSKLYNVTYEYVGHVPADATALPEKESYTAGSEVDVKADATAEGYVFSGWSTDDAEVSENGFTMPAQDVVFKGSFDKIINYYNVTYKYEGEVPANAPAVPDKENYEEGSNVKVENTPALDGYTFIGWETKDAEVKDGQFTINNDVEFVGKWEKIIVDVEDIIIDKDEIELEIGQTDKITVTVTPDDATNKEVTYESGDETVVKVDEKGNITAVGEGTTTITVTSKDDPSIKETVEITVRKPVVDVEDIIIDKDEVELEIGQTDKITVTVTPDNATNREVSYESGDETVVKVDEKGNITAVGEGTTTITVTSKDDPSIKETVEITVRKPEPVKVPVTEVVIEKDNIILGENENTVLDVRVNPENATNKELTFESSNENVVKVDENGKITAVGEGTATVTVTSKDDPSKKDTVTVTVVKREVEYNIIAPDKLSLYVNEAKNLGARVEPSEGAPAIKYSSADESIVKVDENGNVIAVGVGSTTVTLDLGNGTVKVIPVVVLPAPAAPVIPVKHHVCFGKTDGIGWYEVSVNGGDFFPQGPNSTLEVENGSVLVVRVQDMWIDDEFDFYVNGKKVAMDPANTITVVVDGYMLIGALSMDVEVPDVEESLTLFEKILKAIKDFFDWLFGRR